MNKQDLEQLKTIIENEIIKLDNPPILSIQVSELIIRNGNIEIGLENTQLKDIKVIRLNDNEYILKEN